MNEDISRVAMPGEIDYYLVAPHHFKVGMVVILSRSSATGNAAFALISLARWRMLVEDNGGGTSPLRAGFVIKKLNPHYDTASRKG